jgi:hypothetical protein
MATRHSGTRTRADERGAYDARGAYDEPRPMPDEALLAPAQTPYGPAGARSEAMSASGLNVIAGIWLIISPFVLAYSSGDAYWNPIVFGAIVAVVSLARLGGAYRARWLARLNMAIGAWLFISGFWLASTARASWNEWILGVIVFVLGGWSAAAGEDARTAELQRLDVKFSAPAAGGSDAAQLARGGLERRHRYALRPPRATCLV